MDLSALSSNLPPNSPHHRRSNTPPTTVSPDAQLLQAFKSAATSVTLLYKQCATATATARQEGYNDALSDILEVIDNESAYTDPTLALSRIRDWVIETRRKGRREMSADSEDEDRLREHHHSQARQNWSRQAPESSETETTRLKDTEDSQPKYDHPTSPLRPTTNSSNSSTNSTAQPFSYQSMQAMAPRPADVEIDFLSENPNIQQHTSNGMFQFSTPPQPTPLRNSSSHKQTFSSRGNQQLGSGAGSKRRYHNYGEFFDISGFNGSSGNGNPKRGRYS